MQPWEKPKFRIQFGSSKFFFMSFTSTTSRTIFQAIILRNFQTNEKLMNQTWKKTKKQPNFGPDFGQFS